MTQTADVEAEQLTFDPDTHIYMRSGCVLPSVTQILSEGGIIDTSWFTEAAAWRSSVVHKCCQLDDEDDLDEASVPEEAKGYLDSWRLFKSQVPVHFVSIEQPMASELYAGTLDRDAEWAVLDLKTGAIQSWVALQLAAYTELIDPSGIRSLRRFAVRLGKDGKYIVKEFPLRERRSDLAIFRSALSIYNWRKR